MKKIKTYPATGVIFMARALLMQNPAPPVANQNFTFCCNRKTQECQFVTEEKREKKKKMVIFETR